MKKVMVLQHQNKMVYSKEFLQLRVPSEISVLFYVIILLLVVVICIVFFGKIDDVIKVNGIIRTQENVSSVKNVISGKIIEKNYKPGQKVEKGTFLYKIDPAIYDSQRENLVAEQNNLIERLSGLEELFISYNQNKNLVDKKNVVAYTRFESFKTNLEKLIIQTNISYETLKNEENLPVSLRNQKTITQYKMNYDYNQKTVESYKADFLKTINQEKNDLELLLVKNQQEIQKLDSQYEFLKVYAPVEGYVQEISSLNLGDYLESGAKVINIIPNDEKNFRVEMQISPKDMGKIKSGLKVKYRISAFPFFEYKGAEGVITAVDPDIRTGNNGQLYYIAYADIDRVQFENRKGEVFPIRAGLETSSRIVLETEPIITFFLRKIDFLY
jgi:multidrug efflux pump subunit AcrA (membrane-fusion protein)